MLDWEYIRRRDVERAKRLVKSVLLYRRSDASIRPNCRQEDFISWDCCRYHRRLKDRLGALRYRAESLTSFFQSEGMVFSAQWWRDFGKEYEIEIPAELIS